MSVSSPAGDLCPWLCSRIHTQNRNTEIKNRKLSSVRWQLPSDRIVLPTRCFLFSVQLNLLYESLIQTNCASFFPFFFFVVALYRALGESLWRRHSFYNIINVVNILTSSLIQLTSDRMRWLSKVAAAAGSSLYHLGINDGEKFSYNSELKRINFFLFDLRDSICQFDYLLFLLLFNWKVVFFAEIIPSLSRTLARRTDTTTFP